MDKDLTFFWEIVPGTQCNLTCHNCYAADNARPDRRLLGWDAMRDALDKAIAVGMNTVNVLGGEPLAYKHLSRFCEHFAAHVPDGFCGVVSNGTLLTRDRAKSLADSGVSQISVSLDGTVAATHDQNRGAGAFHRALKGIDNTVAARIPLTIAHTVTQFNLADTRDVFSLAKNLGADAVGVQITEPAGRGKVSLASATAFSRAEGLKAIWRMYHTKPPLYTEVSSKSLFKEFLNRFCNAGLSVSPGETCDGGLTTFMVSSGGDMYPCAEYAYEPDGSQRYEGVNLATDDLSTIEGWIEHEYARFNERMRSTAATIFDTCQTCEYRESCAPCPMINAEGKVPECEWVRKKTEEISEKILKSKPILLIEPTADSSNISNFEVRTQERPLQIPMSTDAFMELMTCETGYAIADKHMNEDYFREGASDAVIRFLCALRSHHVIEIKGFETIVEG
ncbi:MAG: radical SAM protein [Gaiellaceae bacterium]